MRKYIVFRAEGRQPGWEDRMLSHTHSLTRILAEYFDSSDRPIPQPGYRPTEFVRVEAEHEPNFHGWSTHYKTGDWEVARVETYTSDTEGSSSEFGTEGSSSEFGMVVICYCRYNPIGSQLKPMPDREVSIDSFGGDRVAYETWLESQKDRQPAEV
ncbi:MULTISPECIES: hypothetical protein [unclassified Microcoleus]|uniref:hypothetical protein n=1 Tax=unclassified Microcoleus TaxID=2642155 RepID=UPI001DAC31F9|nr:MULTISPECIES: hypothetical protein [unclassified Microcoleus]MCC3441250.1 hypothetical protein [Microcoleus sp. PH2017_03_ELD_O_A]MCC3502552.1 hypothetical protein [Microcoleus sp. PH2017_19_SFW_U_A]TAE12459.1 MAG: hypothetical protein EAZ94_12790 [Oscillatoriales cyanobacterium]MCC3415312.1 hypothetical protein [Microcoleus sp. PH2017_02_FOX_O_A]MCC3437420.1 hypothetical protein [Microcoleus sp. PH2017_05_CCC_O_A]